MKLQDWLRETGMPRSELAELIGVTVAHISLLCSGRSLPSIRVAAAIERETVGAVRARDFVDEEVER